MTRLSRLGLHKDIEKRTPRNISINERNYSLMQNISRPRECTKLKNRMRTISRLWIGPFLLMAVSFAAQAQVAEFAVSGGVSKLQNSSLGAGYSLDDGWRMAFRITINSWAHFGQEFGYAYNRST